MTMIKNDQADEALRDGLEMSEILQDERLAAMLSAYLDGALEGEDLQEFKRLLLLNGNLAREVEEMLRVEGQLKLLGEDVLNEPVPPALLNALQGRTGR
jgi:anti-sigma factor RsiW